MDFEYVSTDTEGGWEQWHRTNADATDGVSLARDPTPTYVSPTALTADRPALRVADVALDECGVLYVLSESGDLYRYDHGRDALDHLACVWDAREADAGPSVATALAVTDDSVFVAAGGRVQCLSRHRLQTRWVRSGPFAAPTRLVVDRGRVLVLDPGVNGGAVLALGRDSETQTLVSSLSAPVDLGVDREGTLSVLDVVEESGRTGAVVRRFAPGGDGQEYAEAEGRVRVPESFHASCIAVVDDGELLVGVGPDAPGEQTLHRYLSDRETFERVPGFEGASRGLSHRGRRRGVGRGLYVVDETGRGVAFLREVHPYRRNPRTRRYDASVTRRFDAEDPETEWHRVRLDRDVSAPGTQVRLRYHATDDPDAAPDDVDWTDLRRADPTDALLGDARGRYLWVRLELLGSESASPVVSSLRVYFPRQSYLRYLPAVYREDPASEAFLERFLSLFESVFVDVGEDIAGVTRYLDTYGIPADYLDWLEGWLAVETDETWSETSRRNLLAAAPDLFKRRGTRAGILAVLEIYLDGTDPPVPSWTGARERESERLDALVDRGRLTASEAAAALADYEELEAAGPESGAAVYLLEDRDLSCLDSPEAEADFRSVVGCPHCFVVLVEAGVGADRLRGVRRIVGAESPAHATGRVVSLQPWLELGRPSFLGVNTALPTREFVLEEAGLGRDSVLVEREENGQYGLRSRLGTDASIS